MLTPFFNHWVMGLSFFVLLLIIIAVVVSVKLTQKDKVITEAPGCLSFNFVYNQDGETSSVNPSSLSSDGKVFVAALSGKLSPVGQFGKFVLKGSTFEQSDVVFPPVSSSTGLDNVVAVNSNGSEGVVLYSNGSSEGVVDRWNLDEFPVSLNDTLNLGTIDTSQIRFFGYDDSNVTELNVGYPGSTVSESNGTFWVLGSTSVLETIVDSDLTADTVFNVGYVYGQRDNLLVLGSYTDVSLKTSRMFIVLRTDASTAWDANGSNDSIVFPSVQDGWTFMNTNVGYYGVAISADGLTLYVSHVFATNPDGLTNVGAVLVYTRDSVASSSFVFSELISSDDPMEDEMFGFSPVFVGSDKLVIASSRFLYLYTLSSEGRTLTQKYPWKVSPTSEPFPISVSSVLNNDVYSLVVSQNGFKSNQSSVAVLDICSVE